MYFFSEIVLVSSLMEEFLHFNHQVFPFFLGDRSFLNHGGIVLLPIEGQLQDRVTFLDIMSLLDYFCKLFTTIVFTCKKSNIHLLNS